MKSKLRNVVDDNKDRHEFISVVSFPFGSLLYHLTISPGVLTLTVKKTMEAQPSLSVGEALCETVEQVWVVSKRTDTVITGAS